MNLFCQTTGIVLLMSKQLLRSLFHLTLQERTILVHRATE